MSTAFGKDPIATYMAIFQGTLGDSYGWGEIVVKMIPFILCALATAIPATCISICTRATGCSGSPPPAG